MLYLGNGECIHISNNADNTIRVKVGKMFKNKSVDIPESDIETKQINVLDFAENLLKQLREEAEDDETMRRQQL